MFSIETILFIWLPIALSIDVIIPSSGSGISNSSLIISNKSPSFTQFGFSWALNKNINFEYFHGTLRSLVEDESNSEFYNQVGQKIPELNRFIAAHRLDWNITDRLTIGASEAVVYGVRSLDLMYLLPFAPFLSLQQYLGDFDNIQWVLDFEWKLNSKINLYSAFLMDEWKPSMTFNKRNRNWFAYQVGLFGDKILSDNDFLTIELNWTDHRVYRHQNPINDYYSHGYPIGFWAGPHAEEVLIHYILNKDSFTMLVGCSYAKRGELTQSMLVNQYDNVVYDRFSNTNESISVFDLIISKEIRNGFNLHFGISYIDWANGNFDPFNPNVAVKSTTKSSIMFGFSQNFDIFNQRTNITKNSIKKSISI